MAGQRPSSSAAATSQTGLQLGLLGDLERIVDFDPEIPDSAFKFRVSEQKLYGPEIPGPSVDHHRAGGDETALDHVVDSKPDQIAPPQLAVDSEVEQRKFPRSMIQLQPNPDSPDLFQL